MTEDRMPTNPSRDALAEPTEGHVDVDSATSAHPAGPSGPSTGSGGTSGTAPSGIVSGAGLTDHDQPVEGARDDEDADHADPRGQEREGTSF